RITYECNIITLGNAVSVENDVKIKGMNNLSVAFKANFQVLYIGGNVSTSTEYIYVKKEDKVTGDGVGNVWYDVYVKDHDIGDQSPSVVPYKITIGGSNYYWFTDCETNAGGLMKIEGRDYNLPNGTQQKNILTSGRLYVIRERSAPAGYLLGDDVFFWYDTKPATATDNYGVYQKSDALAFTIQEVPVAEAQLKVKKTLTGGISNEIFTFTISPVTQGAPLPTDARGNKVVAASVSGAGTATFEKIQFTDKGIYEYTVTETAPAVKTPGMKYDTNTWTVRYTVDVVNKLLSVTRTEYLLNGVLKSEVEFINDITYDIYVSKRDLGGKELPGAKMEITGTEKGASAPITKIEWTSDGTNKKVSLRAGDYVLHEVAAPKNYKVAADIKFTVDDYGNVTITSTAQTVGTTTAGDPLIVMTDDYLGYGHINIKKTVTGDLGDKTKDFTFRINLGSDQSFKYTGSKSGTVKNGDTITLKHNESVTILDIPIGVTYEIIESGNEGYKVTATNSKGVIETSGQIVSVSYVNDKTSTPKPQEETDDGGKPKPTKPVPDTGDSSMRNVYIIMALAAVLSVGLISLRGFRRKTKISGKHKD
ncbi:MAG: hypothetical protein HUJ75_05320, partial [Parasporobacterium sp.]|nr:hypothetical protein [Parasporobacterium sp.]